MIEDDNYRQNDLLQSSAGGDSSPDRQAQYAPADADPDTDRLPPRRSAGPSSYTEPYWSSKEQQTERNGRGATKAIAVSLSILVLIIATALIFANNSGDVDIRIGNWEYHSGGDFQDSTDDYFDEDYNDFFENYYNQDNTISGVNSIERAPTGTGATLEFTSYASGPELTLQEIYEKCSPSVVAITADVDDESYYWGSGVILTADGYIITNTHVLDGISSVTVTLWDDSQYEAKLVGADSVSDISVLKIEAAGLVPAEFGNSANLLVGDKVIAIGNPLGEEFRGTMTDGIISAINRNITYNGNTMTLLQTNAAINEGNSGGPLINMYGQVVGITNMKMMSSSLYSSIEGIGFAIPTGTIKPVVDTLIAYGEVTGRPAIGITVGAIPESAANYYDLPDGLYISAVSEGSDAQAKGILVGDILIAVNGIPVASTYEVSAIKDGLEVGASITLTIYRNGEAFDVDVLMVETSDIY